MLVHDSKTPNARCNMNEVFSTLPNRTILMVHKNPEASKSAFLAMLDGSRSVLTHRLVSDFYTHFLCSFCLQGVQPVGDIYVKEIKLNESS
jgi:hypothetical protein